MKKEIELNLSIVEIWILPRVRNLPYASFRSSGVHRDNQSRMMRSNPSIGLESLYFQGRVCVAYLTLGQQPRPAAILVEHGRNYSMQQWEYKFDDIHERGPLEVGPEDLLDRERWYTEQLKKLNDLGATDGN